MTSAQVFVYYFQFILLMALAYVGFALQSTIISAGGMLVFFISEIILLEQARRMNPEKILYRKGCFFACLDLFSVGLFFTYVALFSLMFLGYENYKPNRFVFSGLFVYTLVRKIYIYKNFTYEI